MDLTLLRRTAVKTVQTTPIAGQRPDTSGLRKRTAEFMQPGILENYVQSNFDGIGGVDGKTLTVGGDGRTFAEAAIQTILKMAAGEIAGIAGRLGRKEPDVRTWRQNKSIGII